MRKGVSISDGLRLLREYIERNGVSISPVKMELFRAFGALPGTGDRHVAEFFGHFLTKDTDAGLKYGVRLTTIEDRLQWRARDIERVNKMLSGEMTIEMSRSEETASKIISAIANGRCEIDVLNLPNKGQVNNLPRDAIVDCDGGNDVDCCGDRRKLKEAISRRLSALSRPAAARG